MNTQELVTPALQWLAERPSLANEQLENPIFSLRRAIDEIEELIEAIEQGESRGVIKGELTDALNFIACAEFTLMNEHNFTEQELIDYSYYVYGIRNHAKYPAEGYQNGTPAKEQLTRDANNWMLATIYRGIAEQGMGGEYY